MDYTITIDYDNFQTEATRRTTRTSHSTGDIVGYAHHSLPHPFLTKAHVHHHLVGQNRYVRLDHERGHIHSVSNHLPSIAYKVEQHLMLVVLRLVPEAAQ